MAQSIDNFATAILKTKLKPTILMAEEWVTDDDNCVVRISSDKIEKLRLFRRETVLSKGKRRKSQYIFY